MKLSFFIFSAVFFLIMNLNLNSGTAGHLYAGVLGFHVMITDILLVVALGAVFLEPFAGRPSPARGTSLPRQYARFLLWTGLSAFVISPLYGTPVQQGSISQLHFLGYYLIFFAGVYLFGTDREVRVFIWAFMVSNALVCLRGLAELAYMYKSTGRASSSSSFIRFAEVFHQVLFFFSLCLLNHVHRRLRKYLYASAVLALAAVALSFSRGVILTTALGAVLCVFMQSRSIVSALRPLVLVLAVFFSLFLGLKGLNGLLQGRMDKGFDDIKNIASLLRSPGDPSELIQKGADRSGGDYSLVRKSIEYYDTFREFEKSPVWGLGVGHFYDKLWMENGQKFREGTYVHSIYSYFLMDTGLIGLGLYLLLIFSIGKQFLHIFRTSRVGLYRGVSLACLLSLLALGINSFNGSFLLSIPYIAFVCTFSAIAEAVIRGGYHLAKHAEQSGLHT